MKKKEMIETTVTYCDYCGEKTPRHGDGGVFVLPSGKQVDLCGYPKEGKLKSCRTKYLEGIILYPSKQKE